MDHYENVKLEKIDVSINDRVKIITGPLINLEGKVIEVFNNSLKVSLPSLGYMLMATIEKGNIEVLEPAVRKKVMVS
jgi:transcription antitermination factor NusG